MNFKYSAKKVWDFKQTKMENEIKIRINKNSKIKIYTFNDKKEPCI